MAKVLGNSNNNCVIRARQAWHAVKKAVRKLDPCLPYLYGLVGPVGSLKIINEYGAFNLNELEGSLNSLSLLLSEYMEELIKMSKK